MRTDFASVRGLPLYDAAMLRISHVSNGSGEVRLRLEGQVRGPWVEELRRACEEATVDNGNRAQRLVLDLADVLFVDAEGIMLFRRLTARHVALANCSPFVAEQLKEDGQ